jgi:hypothetical protein
LTGSGTLADPYVIWDVVDLQNMNLDLTAYYELGQDIDATITNTWNGGAGFIPVGDVFVSFTGHFDGKNYTINALFINRPLSDYQGLFGIVNGVTISNCILAAFNITGDNRIGGLVGDARNSSISNVHATNINLTGDIAIGGLVGDSQAISVLNCNVSGSIAGYDDVGGICGLVWSSSTLNQCYSTANIAGTNDEIGGLIGKGVDSTIENSHATGNVTGREEVAGLVGESNNLIITNSYATGSISGKNYTGGFVGYAHSGSNISNCYATGAISDTAAGWGIGGFMGQGQHAGTTIHQCYATGNITISFNSDGIGGFAGGMMNGTITESYSTGNVNGNDNVAGFCGWHSGGATVTDSYARGNATGNQYVAAFVGQNNGSIIERCYGSGLVIGALDVGGFCGWNNDTITDCFWDMQTSLQTTSAGGTGKTTEEMNHRDIYVAAGWDIDTIWNISRVKTGLSQNITSGSALLNGLLDLTIINEAYPFLRWQTVVELPCDCGFEWGETLDLGNFTPVASKNTGDSFAQALSGLKPQTKYYFRSRAHSSPGPIHGGIGTFTTAIGIEVETLPATNITEHSARIWGVVRKVPVTAMGRFDWGGSIEYGQETAWQYGLVSDDMFFVDLDNLAEGRAYHFRAVAMGNIIVYGNDMTFTTLSPLGPVTFIQEELHHILEVA